MLHRQMHPVNIDFLARVQLAQSFPSRTQIKTVCRNIFEVLFWYLSGVFVYAGDTLLNQHAIPWPLVSLIVIAGVAMLWGDRPAFVLLTLSVLAGELVAPTAANSSWQMRILRMALFPTCGVITIWLIDQLRISRRSAKQGKEMTTTLRRILLPQRMAQAPGYDLSTSYRPANCDEQVGGDFYDFYAIKPGVYGIMIGDVMGRGKEAATSTTILRYAARTLAATGVGPAQILSDINRLIENQEIDLGIASLFVGYLDIETHCLRYASAGHEPTLLRRANGHEETLESTGAILGLCDATQYEERSTLLSHKDALLLMTDGVPEARNNQGRFLDNEGAWHLFQTASASDRVDQVLQNFEEGLNRFMGSTAPDDIALLLLRRL